MDIQIIEYSRESYAASYPHYPLRFKDYWICVDGVRTEKYFSDIANAYAYCKCIKDGFIEVPPRYVEPYDELKMKHEKYLQEKFKNVFK